MENQYVPLDVAEDLRTLGFEEDSMGYWLRDKLVIHTPNNYNKIGLLSAPLYRQVIHWLLNKHGLYGLVLPTVTMFWTYKIVKMSDVETPPYNGVNEYDYSTPQEAELKAIKEMIAMIKPLKYLFVIGCLTIFACNPPTPDFTKDGRGYIIRDSCVRSHTEVRYGYMMGKPSLPYHYIRTVCDSTIKDTIEINTK